MTTKTHYQTDDRGYYIGPVECLRDPEEEDERWQVPFGAYADEPPAAGLREIQKRVDGEWVLVPDWRGYTYWLADRSKHTIKEAELTPPVDALESDPGPTETELKALLVRQAQMALDKSDKTVGRCYENGIPVPAAWKDYRQQLRAIVTTQTGEIPAQPDYPAGT